MWGECNRAYIKSHANFTTSGTNESDFKLFCDGRGDVLYLHMWLKIKPNLTSFVTGGLFDDDCFDSILNAEIPSLASLQDNFPTTPSSSSGKTDKVDDGMKDVAASLSKLAEVNQPDPEIQSLEKECLRSQVDQEKFTSIENITNMITKTRAAVKSSKDKVTKAMLQENLDMYVCKRQKLCKEFS